MSNPNDCPSCGSGMTPEAVLCIVCGFDRRTGKRLGTVSLRPTRHCYPEGGSYVSRAILALVLLALVALVAFRSVHDATAGVSLTGAGAVVLALAVGTMRRFTVTKDGAGRTLLIRRWYVGFAPCPPTSHNLSRYRT